MNSTNIPAFPTNTLEARYSGMQLRDYFAGLALQALISSEQYSTLMEYFPRMAYELADDMIEARESSLET